MKKFVVSFTFVLVSFASSSAQTVIFANVLPDKVPFYDSENTLLSGTNYVAQLYAGHSSSFLRPFGDARYFRTGTNSGYFIGQNLTLTGFDPCGDAWIQVRAWERAGGGTFDEAAKAGAWTGLSSTFHIGPYLGGCPLGGGPTIPAPLYGMTYPGSPMIVSGPQSAKARVAENVTLSVVASGGISLFYQWYVGQSGNTNSPITGATNVTLITPALAGDTSFWVRVRTAVGSIDSAAALVTVYPPESILLELSLSNSFSRFILHAPPGGTYQLHSTTNMAVGGWNVVTNLLIPSSPFEYVEPTDINLNPRFYRLMAVK